MTTELVPVGTADEIGELDPGTQAAMVTHALVESKSWLAVATKSTDPKPIANHKAWAATIAEMTRQKGLAAEIQADALEMVRRAERGIGVAVRNGQEAGEIGKKGERTHTGGTPGVLGSLKPDRSPSSRQDDGDLSRSAKAFFNGAQERSDVYQMAEVSDEQFEDVLDEARGEGNMSRANVVRKVKGRASKRTSSQLADQIAALAASGHASEQIASKVDVSEGHVRKTARDFGIEIPADRIARKTRPVDPIRIARETVLSLDGITTTVDQITDLTGLDPNEGQQWASSLTESIRALNRLNRLIKETL